MDSAFQTGLPSYSRKQPERRLSTRFPIAEEIRFRSLDRRGAPVNGTGVTLDICSAGLLFKTDVELELGRLLELSVNWPVALGGTCPLKLVAVGHVVRTGDGVAAVRIEKYQFKTRGRAAGAAAGR
jgi:hypothetical protein